MPMHMYVPSAATDACHDCLDCSLEQLTNSNVGNKANKQNTLRQ